LKFDFWIFGYGWLGPAIDRGINYQEVFVFGSEAAVPFGKTPSSSAKHPVVGTTEFVSTKKASIHC